jgi:hypothetical protein
VEGLQPLPDYNDVFLPVSESQEKGWPRFKSSEGKNLFRNVQGGLWVLRDEYEYDAADAEAFVTAANGLLPEGVRLWTVADAKPQLQADLAGPTRRRKAREDENWKTHPVKITLLQSDESVHTETERLQVLRQSLHEERAKAEEAARAERFVAVREIFAMFDEDRDGILSANEYRAYLAGLGRVYSDDSSYEERWRSDCEATGCTEPEAGGITWETFEGVVYGKFRTDKAQADLEMCKAARPDLVLEEQG